MITARRRLAIGWSMEHFPEKCLCADVVHVYPEFWNRNYELASLLGMEVLLDAVIHKRDEAACHNNTDLMLVDWVRKWMSR